MLKAGSSGLRRTPGASWHCGRPLKGPFLIKDSGRWLQRRDVYADIMTGSDWVLVGGKANWFSGGTGVKPAELAALGPAPN